MSKANIEHLANAWCDEGHKSDDVFKIEVDGKDFQLCSEHLASILSKKLGDAPNLRGLPVVEYKYTHNDRGEFRRESIIIEGTYISRGDYEPEFSLKAYPKLQEVFDLIKDQENICLVKTDEMTGKYDSMEETKRFLVSSKDFINCIDEINDLTR